MAMSRNLSAKARLSWFNKKSPKGARYKIYEISRQYLFVKERLGGGGDPLDDGWVGRLLMRNNNQRYNKV